jgi:hypothetical protein
MFRHLFNVEIFMVEEEGEIASFSLGDNPSQPVKLIVLLKDENNERAVSPDIDMLNKIADWKEYHLKREEVVVLNLAHQNVSLKQLLKKFPSPNIVCFEISPDEIALQIEHKSNRLIRFNGVNFVFTASLQEISKNEKLKKQFFVEGLKPMFSSSDQNPK